MCYSRVNPGDEPDFFSHYYPPTWSILYWLSQDTALPTDRLEKRDVTNAVRVHSMAMSLHSMDDHLTDGQIPVTHLTLLLRSQTWTIMNRAYRNLAEGVPEGEKTAQGFIDDYYSSIRDSKEPESLDSYCDLFRRQMAIGMIAPVLLSMKMTGVSDFTRDIEMAYGSFGIAWRLLDDIKDIGDDIEKGSHTAIYFCLPDGVRNHWDNNVTASPAAVNDSTDAVLDHVLRQGLIDSIRERVCAELETAASLVDAHNLKGLAREFRCLAHPLKISSNTSETDNGRFGISTASTRMS
jgi:hypothetical protein